MAEEEAVRTDEQEQPEEEAPQPKPDIDWKAEARKWERRAKENAAAARRLAEIEESQKSEQQKIAERLAEAERKARDAEVKMLRAKVAAAKGLPPALAARLQGETEDEITADADDLLASLKAAGNGERKVDLKQGTRGQPVESDPNAWLRRMAGRR